MKAVNPYLNFNGNTEEAFNFYKSVFGTAFSFLMRFKDTPETVNLSAEDGQKIMHICLPFGNGNMLFGTDACESMGHSLKTGNNFFISIMAESETEARELFSKLSANGHIQVPIDKMFWGDLFGQCVDKFGVQWMVSHHEEK